MAEPHGHEFIIVKRHEEEEHEAHSSAWKVAHADFMTAMMAFFLIMWLINATDDKVRRGISNYFNPIHMSDGQSGMKGLAKPGEAPQKESGVKQSGKGNSKTDEFNPLKLSPGASEEATKGGEADASAAHDGSEGAVVEGQGGEAAVAGAAAAGKGGDAIEEGAGAAGAGAAAVGNGAGEHGPAKGGASLVVSAGKAASGATPAASHGEVIGAAAKGQEGGGEGAFGGTGAGMLATFGDSRERAAFQDPYAVLAKLAAQYSSDHPTSADVVVGDDRKPGLAGGEVDRDPFDPVYWQLAGTPPAKAYQPGKPGTSASVPEGSMPDAAAKVALPDEAGPGPGPEPVPPSTEAAADLPDVKLRPTQPDVPEPARPAPVEAKPVEPKPVETAKMETPAAAKPEPASPPPAAAVAEPPKPTIDAAVIAAAEAIRAAVAGAVAPTVAADASPKISVVATSEGVAINLTDAADFTMFDVGSAVPKGKVVVLMGEVAKALANKPGEVIIRGHTDARPFHSDMYDNWRLSAARAHMAYYMLTRGGLPEKRVIRIEGAADRDLKNANDPLAAENRRIEILLVPPKP